MGPVRRVIGGLVGVGSRINEATEVVAVTVEDDTEGRLFAFCRLFREFFPDRSKSRFRFSGLARGLPSFIAWGF